MKKILLLLSTIFLLNGCAESLALLGPGASNGRFVQSSLNSAISYGVKKQTGKTPLEHAIAFAEEKNPERKKEWVSRDSTSYGVTMLGDTVRLIKIGSTAGTAYSSETWVTWGWFEDNVLNKFTSFASNDEST